MLTRCLPFLCVLTISVLGFYTDQRIVLPRPCSYKASLLPADLADATATATRQLHCFLSETREMRAVIEFDTSISDVIYSPLQNAMPFLTEFTRQLIDTEPRSSEQTEIRPLQIFFPDMGAAVLAKKRWLLGTNSSEKDSSVLLSSIQRDKVLANSCFALVACPQYSEADCVRRVVEECAQEQIPCIILNPALVNNDQGFGVRARIMRTTLLDTFEVVYKLRTLPNGALVRTWPRPYTVWREDLSAEGGYKLMKTFASAPSGEQIELALQGKCEDESAPALNLLKEAVSLWRGLSKL